MGVFKVNCCVLSGADYTCEECCVSFKCHYALERHKNTRSHCMFVLALKQPEVSKPSLQPDSALDTDDGITQVSAHLINSTISHL